MHNGSSTTYSTVKEINKDEDIVSSEYKSTNIDENAISVSGEELYYSNIGVIILIKYKKEILNNNK